MKKDVLLSEECITNEQGIVLSYCRIHKKSQTDNTWIISSWFTKEEYQNKGLGSQVFCKTIRKMYSLFGKPDAIQYIWNGQNNYVYEWLEKHFDAKCNCPLAVQKTQAEDDWDSHVYNLDKTKVLQFCKIPI